MKDHSVEGFIGGVIITLFITLPWVCIDTPKNTKAAINDSGKATDYKLQEIIKRIDNYNLESLKGNK